MPSVLSTPPSPSGSCRSSSSGEFNKFFASDTNTTAFALPSSLAHLPRIGASKRYHLSQANITELVRVSCEKLAEQSKYVEINYDFLKEYARLLSRSATNHTGSALTDSNLPERERINMSFLVATLQYGSNFTKLFVESGPRSLNDAVKALFDGVTRLQQEYETLDIGTLSSLSFADISALFDIKVTEPCGAGYLLIASIQQCIQKTINILSVKQFHDFADYVYHYIDLAWIKSQTANLSALKTISFELSEEEPRRIGLIFAPTQSPVVRRCVLIDYEPTAENGTKHVADCAELIKDRGFLYAVQDEVVYNKPFEEIVSIIKKHLNAPRVNESGKPEVALQFGMHLDREPDTVQVLLSNLANDFSVFNDQYVCNGFYGDNRHLKVYLFECAQSIVMALYHNIFVAAAEKDRNPLFNFKGVDSLTAVSDSVIPYVLLQDGVIKIKDEGIRKLDRYNNGSYVLKRSDLEIEMMASTVHAMDILVHFMPANIAKLVYLLKKRGAEITDTANI